MDNFSTTSFNIKEVLYEKGPVEDLLKIKGYHLAVHIQRLKQTSPNSFTLKKVPHSIMIHLDIQF